MGHIFHDHILFLYFCNVRACDLPTTDIQPQAYLVNTHEPDPETAPGFAF